MAIRYQISTRSSFLADRAFDFAERQRLPAALDELWRQIFDVISGDGARDTARGWRLKREFDAYAEKLTREGLRPGHYRKDTFYLNLDENGRGNDFSWHVTFWQERV
jgi:hypothetical protein